MEPLILETRRWKKATNANAYDTLEYLYAHCLRHSLDLSVLKEAFDEVEHPFKYNVATNHIEYKTRKRKRDGE